MVIQKTSCSTFSEEKSNCRNHADLKQAGKVRKETEGNHIFRSLGCIFFSVELCSLQLL